MARPVAHSYGKEAVSVYRTDGETLLACEVRLIAHGDAFLPAYTEGDNSAIVATDSMKNFIQRAAVEYEGTTLEGFLADVARRFLDRYEHVDWVDLHAREVPFTHRVGVVFQRAYGDQAVAELAVGRDGIRYRRSGLEGLHLIKLSGSAFTGFIRDEYTTLPESEDRPLFVHLDIHWRTAEDAGPFPVEAVRATLVEAFSATYSASIQELLHAMGVGVLERFSEIEEVSLTGENRLWDTAAAGDGVTVYTDARPPFGVVSLTLHR
jgi:urate oxidase